MFGSTTALLTHWHIEKSQFKWRSVLFPTLLIVYCLFDDFNKKIITIYLIKRTSFPKKNYSKCHLEVWRMRRLVRRVHRCRSRRRSRQSDRTPKVIQWVERAQVAGAWNQSCCACVILIIIITVTNRSRTFPHSFLTSQSLSTLSPVYSFPLASTFSLPFSNFVTSLQHQNQTRFPFSPFLKSLTTCRNVLPNSNLLLKWVTNERYKKINDFWNFSRLYINLT